MHLDSRSAKALDPILKGVSRSFYLTLRVLPASIRPQIGLAYLIARLTDTIADTDAVPIDRRLRILQSVRERVMLGKTISDEFNSIREQQALPAEIELLRRQSQVFELLDRCSQDDKHRICQLLDTIISGQELDLQRFGGASPNHINALETTGELEDYAYRVAGCVGEFWTRMCLSRQMLSAQASESQWLELGVRFGKGLQYTNILRDIPKDLNIGRCYIPRQDLAKAALRPEQLTKPEHFPAFEPVYFGLLDRTLGYLESGWQYTLKIPRSSVRLRLACAWPVLIGVQTIQRLRQVNVLDPDLRVKISRRDVRNILLKSLVIYPFPNAWRQLYSASLKNGIKA
jgi:farnesyl-diphosphate farnesyltransferase